MKWKIPTRKEYKKEVTIQGFCCNLLIKSTFSPQTGHIVRLPIMYHPLMQWPWKLCLHGKSTISPLRSTFLLLSEASCGFCEGDCPPSTSRNLCEQIPQVFAGTCRDLFLSSPILIAGRILSAATPPPSRFTTPKYIEKSKILAPKSPPGRDLENNSNSPTMDNEKHTYCVVSIAWFSSNLGKKPKLAS